MIEEYVNLNKNVIAISNSDYEELFGIVEKLYELDERTMGGDFS